MGRLSAGAGNALEVSLRHAVDKLNGRLMWNSLREQTGTQPGIYKNTLCTIVLSECQKYAHLILPGAAKFEIVILCHGAH